MFRGLYNFGWNEHSFSSFYFFYFSIFCYFFNVKISLLFAKLLLWDLILCAFFFLLVFLTCHLSRAIIIFIIFYFEGIFSYFKFFFKYKFIWKFIEQFIPQTYIKIVYYLNALFNKLLTIIYLVLFLHIT